MSPGHLCSAPPETTGQMRCGVLEPPVLLKLLPSESSLLSLADRQERETGGRKLGCHWGRVGGVLAVVSIGCSWPEHWRCFWRLAKTCSEAELVVGGGPGRDRFEVSFPTTMPEEVL